MKSKVAIQLVSWNSASTIAQCIASLEAQTYVPLSLYIWDNDSNDHTPNLLTHITDVRTDTPCPVHVTYANENVGFTGGHNALWSMNQAPYVLLVNPDTVLDQNYISLLVDYLEKHPACAQVSGLLMRSEQGTKTETIDSLGLRLLPSHRCMERMSGEVALPPSLSDAHEVFGVSGALVLLRRSAADAVGDGRLFAQEFFAYKEDVDLSYRLILSGYTCAVVPHARAWHERKARTPRKIHGVAGTHATLKHRHERAKHINVFSYINHLRMLYRNVPKAIWHKYWMRIVSYELGKAIIMLLTAPVVFMKAFAVIWNSRHVLSIQRKNIQSHITAKTVERLDQLLQTP